VREDAKLGPITAVRSQVQAAASLSPQPQEVSLRHPLVGSVAPVTTPQRPDAVTQSAASLPTLTVHLAERDESDHPVAEARIAAEAARQAYIRASIAAGASPLPLPGA
jgi:hypothetical protein